MKLLDIFISADYNGIKARTERSNLRYVLFRERRESGNSAAAANEERSRAANPKAQKCRVGASYARRERVSLV